jgi:KUP system potassium uptake protein
MRAGSATAAAGRAKPDPAGAQPHGAGGRGLVLAALGVVFGDIGTSPLYALHTVFSIDNGAVRPTPGDVYGVISLMFWSVTLIVSIKYVSVIMRADNGGEGGVMALAALAQRLYSGRSERTGLLLVIGIVGVSLFYGDSVITPAISVLSAVEGVQVAAPSLGHVVVPVAAVILTCLFAVQRFGTSRVGKLFGPITVVWFLTLAVAGLHGVLSHPGVLRALSPTYALLFAADHPRISFVAMGAVVLVITGAEALYADMGHFGRAPIRRAWFFLVFPALTLNYLGQAALILHSPQSASNPFFLLLPSWSRLPMVVLATAATVIASQAVISGAFSLSRQAMQLGLLPPMTVRQTSEREGGQVYLPAVNAALFVGVLVIMLGVAAVEAGGRSRGVRRRRGDLPGGEPVQGDPRRLAAAGHRRRGVHRDDDLAAGPGDRGRQPPGA